MNSSDPRSPRGASRICLPAVIMMLAAAASVPSKTYASDLWVTAKDGIISVEARDVSIRHILKEIARQTGLEVITRDPLSERVTVHLNAISLFQAMRRILKGRSYTLRDVPYEKGHVTRLWILSADPGSFASNSTQLQILGPVPPEKSAIASTFKLAGNHTDLAALAGEALNHHDPITRREAVYTLGEVGASNIHVLGQALMDPSAEVRESAIEALADIGGDESAAALEVALNDADVSVRTEAVEALGAIGGDTATRLLRIALADETTRETATELLAELSKRRR